jgi:hypothetical protein
MNFGGMFWELLQVVRFQANGFLKKNAIVPKIAQGQSYPAAVERVPELRKRLVPSGGIKRAVVDRPNQVR